MRAVKAAGFSLLEVLIAGFILFLVVSTASVVFSGAIKSKVNAENAVLMHGYTPLIAEHVATLVTMGESSGSSRFLDVEYSWVAKSQKQKPIQALSDGLQGGSDNQPLAVAGTNKTATLWLVTVNLRGSTRKEFSFNVTTWS